MSADVVAACIAAGASLGSAGIAAAAVVLTSRGNTSTARRLDEHGALLATVVGTVQRTDERVDVIDMTHAACPYASGGGAGVTVPSPRRPPGLAPGAAPAGGA